MFIGACSIRQFRGSSFEFLVFSFYVLSLLRSSEGHCTIFYEHCAPMERVVPKCDETSTLPSSHPLSASLKRIYQLFGVAFGDRVVCDPVGARPLSLGHVECSEEHVQHGQMH